MSKARDGSKRAARDSDRSLFESAMRDVEPIRRKGRIAPSRRGKGQVPSPNRHPGAGHVRFKIDRWGEQVTGLAAGEDPRLPGRLQRPDAQPDLRIDLHGLDLASGRREVRCALEELWACRGRILLVIHGRGLRSGGAPVLKAALPSWLEEPPHGARVRAFATASPANGGGGATLVLLRRRKGVSVARQETRGS